MFMSGGVADAVIYAVPSGAELALLLAVVAVGAYFLGCFNGHRLQVYSSG